MMSTLAFVQGLSSVRFHAKKIFSKYLLITNTAITVGLSGAGDILQQRYEIYCKQQEKWDYLRTKQVCLSGFVIGPTCHYWYIFLDRLFPGRTISVICKKILLDQVVFSPVNISIFVLLMGALRRKTQEEMYVDFKEKGLELLKAEWIIWPPAQLVNFVFVPLRYRVLFDNTVSLGFDYYYSYIMFRKYKKCRLESDDEEDFNNDNNEFFIPSYCCKIPEHSSV